MKVFLSSTSLDLKEYREAACEVCKALELHAIDMADFDPGNPTGLETSLRELSRANVYVGIIAHRYGYIPTGHDLSVTELEFDKAGSLKLDRLCFVIEQTAPWRGDWYDFEHYPKLISFKAKIDQTVTRKEFTSTDDFARKLQQALSVWKEKHNPGPKPSVPQQLPPPPPQFVGRVDLLASLHARLSSGSPLIGLRGMGGVGKTGLALHFAHAVKERFPHGHLYIDLKGVYSNPLTPAEVMKHVIRSYEPEKKLPEDELDLKGRYYTVLSGKTTLLLFDNARDDKQLESLLPPPSCTVIITSRSQLTLPGIETAFVGELPHDDAIALLGKHSNRAGNLASEIVTQCGRLPLAVQLAGSILATRPDLTPADYLKRLQGTRDRLSVIDKGAPDRGGVKASLGLSESLLSNETRCRFRRLAVFVGGFDQSAARMVWDQDEDSTDSIIGALLRASLLEWNATAQEYYLHDLIRAYADALLQGDERQAALQGHAHHYLAVTQEAEDKYQKGGDDLLVGLRSFDRNWRNIEAAFRWATDHHATDPVALEMGRSFPLTAVHCLWLRQSPRVHLHWFTVALDAARQLNDRAAETRALLYLGVAHRDLGDLDSAIATLDQSLALAREMNNLRDQANALGNLGTVHVDQGVIARGMQCYQEVLSLADQIKDDRIKVNALCALGIAHNSLNQFDQAVPLLQEQFELARKIGDRRGEANALGNLGISYLNLARYSDAQQAFEHQLLVARVLGDRQNECSALGNLGVIHSASGNLSEATAHLEEHLARATQLGDQYGEVNALANLGAIHNNMGYPEKALPVLERLLAIGRQLSNKQIEARALGYLGVSHFLSGDIVKSLDYLERHRTLIESLELRPDLIDALTNLGEAHLEQGDATRALALFEQSLPLAREYDNRPAECYILGNLALAFAALGQMDRAIETGERQLNLAEELGDRRGLALAKWNLGKVLALVGQRERARELMQARIDLERLQRHGQVEKHEAEMQRLTAV